MAFSAQSFLLVVILLLLSPPSWASEVRVVVSQAGIEKVASEVFPITVNGIRKLGLGPFQAGASYVATVNHPRISITEKEQVFLATASVELTGHAVIEGIPVRGVLDINFNDAKDSLVIDIRSASARVGFPGGFFLDIDVSNDIPGFPLIVAIPSVSFGFNGSDVEVYAKPNLHFSNGDVVIEVTLVVDARGGKPSGRRAR